MFKLLFFFFLFFIIYKGIQFLSKLYSIYDSARGQQQGSSKKTYQKKTDGETTIHFDPGKENQKNGKSKNKDEDYIDYEEIKKES